MVGKDAGKQGRIIKVVRELNLVYVERTHMVGWDWFVPCLLVVVTQPVKMYTTNHLSHPQIWMMILCVQKLEKREIDGLGDRYAFIEQPLDVAKGEVKLVDPTDKWV